MTSKKKKNADEDFLDGQNHLRKGRYSAALDSFSAAIKSAPENHQYIVMVSDLLENISFNKYSLDRKNLIFTCLKTPRIDYQGLWQSWYSIILCSPLMKDFQCLVRGESYHTQKLYKSLKDPFFLEGLKKLIVYDMAFENALKFFYQDIRKGGQYPKEFKEALEIYCLNTEYIFCDSVEEVELYPVDESIQTISLSNDKISNEVRSQYEENPYPRWITAPNIKPNLDQTHTHLIAGCGTGYSTCMTAMMYPNAQITAIDLSLASLSYAKKKAEELGITNVTFYQADILSLGELDQQFDVIECSGVLHHMEDPVKGWRALIEKLKPDGRMHIGLYSEFARRDVVAARKIIVDESLEPTLRGIQKAREHIVALPEDHAAYKLLGRRDFYTTSSCRDLIFHAQEHRFTLLQLKEVLGDLGLVFERFTIEDREILARYKQRYSGTKDLIDLELWHEFEKDNTDTFKGMYQFWCCKK